MGTQSLLDCVNPSRDLIPGEMVQTASSKARPQPPVALPFTLLNSKACGAYDLVIGVRSDGMLFRQARLFKTLT